MYAVGSVHHPGLPPTWLGLCLCDCTNSLCSLLVFLLLCFITCLSVCQVVLKDSVDLRHAALGPRGYKLKPIKSGLSSLKKVQQAAAQQEQQQQEPEGMDTDGAPEPYAAPAVKRQKAEGVAYRNVSAGGAVGAGGSCRMQLLLACTALSTRGFDKWHGSKSNALWHPTWWGRQPLWCGYVKLVVQPAGHT